MSSARGQDCFWRGEVVDGRPKGESASATVRARIDTSMFGEAARAEHFPSCRPDCRLDGAPLPPSASRGMCRADRHSENAVRPDVVCSTKRTGSLVAFAAERGGGQLAATGVLVLRPRRFRDTVTAFLLPRKADLVSVLRCAVREIGLLCSTLWISRRRCWQCLFLWRVKVERYTGSCTSRFVVRLQARPIMSSIPARS